jgi:tetratricopeptide (TPR) repeat protein
MPWGQTMRFTFPLLAAASLLAVCAGAPAQAQSGANAELCASHDYGAHTPAQRIAACTALIDAAKDMPAPELSTLLTSRGVAYAYTSDMKSALADLDRAIALDAQNEIAVRERARDYRMIGRLEQALVDINAALRLKPSDVIALDVRANIFNNNRQYDRAIEDYNEALRINPKFAQSYRNRGAAYYFKGDYQAAIKDYDQAIKLDPKDSHAFTNRGAAYKKLGRYDQAIADDSEAIKLDPTVPEYFDNRGLNYEDNGDYERALADFNEAIRIQPKVNFITNRADIYNRMGQYDRAIENYDRALSLNPAFTLAYYNRGVAYHSKGDLDNAIADFEQALRINPHMDIAAEMLAKAREERARRQLAGPPVKPTFDCTTATLAVEKAICADPQLAKLDREVGDAYKAALGKLSRKGAARLRREQRAFVARRDKEFGRADYHFRRELERRLAKLREMGG